MSQFERIYFFGLMFYRVGPRAFLVKLHVENKFASGLDHVRH